MNNDTMKNFGSSKSIGKAHERDVREIAEEVKVKVVELKDRAIEAKDNVLKRGGSAAEKVRDFTTANPLKAVAIAFAFGFFAMRVTRPLRWL
jgi:ElaB/YqjD/DUF883 family membrane-anchored ribosome-binding protein